MLQEFRHTLNDPAAMHAALVHFPIALSIAGLLLLVGLAAMRFRPRDLKITVVACYALAALLGFAASQKGLSAEDRASRVQPPLTHEEHEAIEAHEELGENAYWWIAIPGALGALTLLRPRPAQVGAGVAALVAALCVAGYVGYLGHTGGRIVYVHGLGTPERAGATAAPAGMAAPAPEVDDDGAGEDDDDDAGNDDPD